MNKFINTKTHTFYKVLINLTVLIPKMTISNLKKEIEYMRDYNTNLYSQLRRAERENELLKKELKSKERQKEFVLL